MQQAATWKDYWQTKTIPEHREEADDFYRRHAAEVRLMFAEQNPSSVLEIGCGSGVLYPYLGFEGAAFTGVDFSESMLSQFARRYPGLDLKLAEGSGYNDGKQYDLIFSNAVVQYFDKVMLRRHFANVRAMMGPKSSFVCASIPWAVQRTRYVSGGLTPPYRASLVRLGADCLRTLLRTPDHIGYWYTFNDILALAAEQGMMARFFGGVCYIYRFHAVMTLA